MRWKMTTEVVTISNLGEVLEYQIKQGATWNGGEFELRYENEDGTPGDPVDFTGAVIEFQFRKTGLGTGTPAAVATCTITDATGGKFVPTLTAAQTAAVPAGETVTDKASAYTFDVFATWTATGIKWELYHGNAFFFRRVTK